MSKTIYLLIFILASLPSIAQKKITIVYKTSTHFEKADIQKFMDESIVENGLATIKSDSLKKMADELIDDFLNDVDSTTIKNPSLAKIKHAYRENEEVVVKDMGGYAKGRSLFRYNVKTLLLTRIDSIKYHKIDTVNVTKNQLTDTSNLLNRVNYKIQFTKEVKKIMGYKCQKIYVVPLNKAAGVLSDIQQYEIWATKDIKPAISVNAVLLFCKAILTEFTALEIKEIMKDAPNSYNLTTASEMMTNEK